jgi:hypothetical protein
VRFESSKQMNLLYRSGLFKNNLAAWSKARRQTCFSFARVIIRALWGRKKLNLRRGQPEMCFVCAPRRLSARANFAAAALSGSIVGFNCLPILSLGGWRERERSRISAFTWLDGEIERATRTPEQQLRLTAFANSSRACAGGLTPNAYTALFLSNIAASSLNLLAAQCPLSSSCHSFTE